MSKLSGDPYAEEFIRILSMGADPDTFRKTSYESIKSKGVLSNSGHCSGKI
jgi:hypothetical protein